MILCVSRTAKFFSAVHESGSEDLKWAFKNGYNFEVDTEERVYLYCPDGDYARDEAVENEYLMIVRGLFSLWYIEVFYDGLTFEEVQAREAGGGK
jgi:hypothetical protein